jgi:Putative Ig domain/Fibronectin type III domain
MNVEGDSSSMPPRFIFFMIAVLTLTLSPAIPATSASVAKIQIQAITDSKPGEVEVTFLSQGSKSPKSLITSYQIVAKPVGASGLVFSKSYSKRVSGYMKQKVSPLSPGVDYIFTLTQRSVDKKVTRSTPYSFTTEPTSPSAPRITSASATDSDEAVIFFDAPINDGGTPILSYTVTANPGQIITTSNQQVAGSITALGLTKATNYTFTITAQNLYGRSEPSLISPSITTLAQKIVRSSPASTTAPPLAAPAFTISSVAETRTVNTAATGFITTSTGGAIASFAINATPAGMSFNTTTGALTGTPNTVAAATNYTITATNASGSATQTFRLTVSAVVYTVGQTRPGGGIVFYVATTSFACGPTRAATCTYLEVAPNTWNGGTQDPTKLWAVNANKHIDVTEIPNEAAANNDIAGLGVGLQNSIAIVNQGNDTTTAAGAARAYRGGTQSDWFLPATVELNLLCQWARNVTQAVSTPCTGGTLNTGTGANGGFEAGIYWSSVEHNPSDVRFQNFSNGEQSNQLGKDTSIRVRPIRAF